MSESEPDDALSFITTDDLLEELMDRFDHAAFCGLMALGTEAEDEQGAVKVTRVWAGNHHTIIGLLSDTARHVGLDFDDDSKKDEE